MPESIQKAERHPRLVEGLLEQGKQYRRELESRDFFGDLLLVRHLPPEPDWMVALAQLFLVNGSRRGRSGDSLPAPRWKNTIRRPQFPLPEVHAWVVYSWADEGRAGCFQETLDRLDAYVGQVARFVPGALPQSHRWPWEQIRFPERLWYLLLALFDTAADPLVFPEKFGKWEPEEHSFDNPAYYAAVLPPSQAERAWTPAIVPSGVQWKEVRGKWWAKIPWCTLWELAFQKEKQQAQQQGTNGLPEFFPAWLEAEKLEQHPRVLLFSDVKEKLLVALDVILRRLARPSEQLVPIYYLEEQRYQVPGKDSFSVTEAEHTILQIFLHHGPQLTKPELEKKYSKQGEGDPVRILKRLVKKSSFLEESVYFPGRKGKGGYKVVVRKGKPQI